MNDNACNLPSCYSCNRVDQLELNDDTTSMVTYLGEYAVVTSGALELDSAPAALAFAMGYCTLENAYITTVVYLGDEKASLKQSYYLVEDDNEFYRYWTRHDDLDNLKEAHQMVVEGVKSGLIDVSVGRGDEMLKERDASLLRMKAETAKSTKQPWDGKL